MKTITLLLTIVTLSFTTLSAQIIKNSSIGIGLGVPYGVLGINGEVAVHPHFSLSAGVGSTLFAGVGYAIGARAYLFPADKVWRPRVSVHYGVNSMIVAQASGDMPKDGKKFSGLTLGIGTLAMFGDSRKSGFDFEIAYLATTGELENEINKMNASGDYEHIDMPGKIKIILGYRFGINYSKHSISPKPEVQEKNLVFIGGGFNLSSDKIKDGAETLSFSITPKIGYFLNDNFALGLGLGYSTSKRTGNNGNEVFTSNSWSFDPFARYYVAKTGNLSFFGEGSIEIGGSTATDNPKFFTMAVRVSPALSYNLSDKVSLEANLGGLSYSSITDKDDTYKSTGIGLNFGLDDITFGAIIKF